MPDTDDLTLKEWPCFSWDACPGLLGDFVRLATHDSEADPAAVCVTTLVRFGAEIYSYGGHSGLGLHFYVGETSTRHAFLLLSAVTPAKPVKVRRLIP